MFFHFLSRRRQYLFVFAYICVWCKLFKINLFVLWTQKNRLWTDVTISSMYFEILNIFLCYFPSNLLHFWGWTLMKIVQFLFSVIQPHKGFHNINRHDLSYTTIIHVFTQVALIFFNLYICMLQFLYHYFFSNVFFFSKSGAETLAIVNFSVILYNVVWAFFYRTLYNNLWHLLEIIINWFYC